MFAKRNDHQVFNIIIERISVNMVDQFSTFKFSTKIFLHKISMIFLHMTVYSNFIISFFIAIFMESYNTISKFLFTFFRTKQMSILMAVENFEVFSAVQANFCNRFFIGFHKI